MSKTVFQREYAGEGANDQLAFLVDFKVCGQGLSSVSDSEDLFLVSLLFEFRCAVGQTWAYKTFSRHNRFEGREQVLEGF